MLKKIVCFCLAGLMSVACVVPAGAVDPVAEVAEGSVSGVIGTAVDIYEIAEYLYQQWKKDHPDTPDSEYSGYKPGGSFDEGGNHIDGSGGRDNYDKWLSHQGFYGRDRSGGYFYHVPFLRAAANYNCSKVDDFTVSVNDRVGNGNCLLFIFGDWTFPKGGTAKFFPHGTGDFVSIDPIKEYSVTPGQHMYETDYFVIGDQYINGTFSLTCAIYPPDSYIEPNNDRPVALPGDAIQLPGGKPGGLIVNEDNDTITNPITGNVYTGDWTYDYSNRTYTMTTDNSQHISVEYGDQNITINEGGNTYNIYYVIPDQTPVPGPNPDKPGTDIKPNDEDMQTLGDRLLQALANIGGFFGSLAQTVKGLFSGFTDFLVATFPFMPPEFFNIIELGLIMMVVAGVLRRFP